MRIKFECVAHIIKVGVDRILKFLTISAEVDINSNLNLKSTQEHTSVLSDLDLAEVESGDVLIHHMLQCGLELGQGSLTVGAPRRIEL